MIPPLGENAQLKNQQISGAGVRGLETGAGIIAATCLVSMLPIGVEGDG